MKHVKRFTTVLEFVLAFYLDEKSPQSTVKDEACSDYALAVLSLKQILSM